jgi:hypothetical protein
MKKSAVIGVLALIAGGVIYRLGKNPEKIIQSLSERPSTLASESVPVLMTSELARKSSFSRPTTDSNENVVQFTPREADELRTAVQSSLSYLRQEHRRRFFQESDSDRIELQQKALLIIGRNYQNPISAGEATQRVLAIQALALSKHTRSNDCFEGLSSLSRQFESADTPQIKGAVGADLLAVARACHAIDKTVSKDVAKRNEGSSAASLILSAVDSNS